MTSNYARPTPPPLKLATSSTPRPLPFAPLSPPLPPPPPVAPSAYISSDRPRPSFTPHGSSGTILPLPPRSESALSGREKNGSLPSPPVSEPRGSAEGSDGERIQGSKVEKKANPLEDLIHTETLYVEDLGAIIKRVAGAWSRANFPPAALDSMFRAVEAVYRINKSLLSQLLEIGPAPASPKALGDLLMRWISDIEPAYSRYTTTFLTSFDAFPPVQSNPRLHEILATLSWPGTLPLPLPPVPSDVDFPLPPSTRTPSLDDFFQLPIVRLKYYKKLYAKLLKSTQEGRSDHVLLVGANERLDALLVKCELAMERSVVQENTLVEAKDRKSDGSGQGPSLSSGSDRFSSQTGTSAATSGKLLNGPPKIEDLERRLCTDRALDIFTMLPKKCKLQMAPPNLPFIRTLRRSADVVLSFTPRSDPAQREVVVRRAYIFLLTDLFLICERMTSDERAEMVGPNGEGPDMWLLYPPLAGKHLRVKEGREGEVEITVLGKEKLVIRTEGRDAALEWRRTFEEAIAFGVSQGVAIRSDSAASLRTDPRTDSEPSNSPTFLPHIKTSGAAFRNGPLSPLSADSRARPSPEIMSPRFDQPPAEFGIGYGRPPKAQGFDQRQPEQQWDRPQEPPASREQWERQRDGQRRAASAGPAAPLPPRKQSMFNGQGHQSLSATTAPASFAQPSDDFGRFASSPLNANFPPNGYPPQDGHYPPLPTSPNGQYPPPPPPPNANYAYANGGYAQQPSPVSSNFASRSQSSSSQYAYPTPSFSGPHSEPLQKSNSSRSNGSNGSASGRTDRSSAYPLPPFLPNQQYSSRGSGSLLTPGGSIHRSRSADGLRDNHYRAPSVAMGDNRSTSAPGSTYGGQYGAGDESPPPSPLDKAPEVTTIVAQMRCKAFLQQNHAQWKSLGTAKLKLFVSTPSGTKQLVVDSDKSDKKTFVSTIVLTDGVERVGKTGVAIELSNRGARTGIIYMLQMKTEQSAVGLFGQLLMGSDRASGPRR